MTITKPTIYLIIALFLGAVFAMWGSTAIGSITYQAPLQPGRITTHSFFVATTTTATSTNDTLIPSNQTLRIEGAKKVTFLLTHGGTATTSTGGSKFSVQQSFDGSTWYDFNKLIRDDVSSTATSTVTIQGATSTVVASMKLTDDTFRFVRCVSTEISTLGIHGEASCAGTAEF